MKSTLLAIAIGFLSVFGVYGIGTAAHTFFAERNAADGYLYSLDCISNAVPIPPTQLVSKYPWKLVDGVWISQRTATDTFSHVPLPGALCATGLELLPDEKNPPMFEEPNPAEVPEGLNSAEVT